MIPGESPTVVKVTPRTGERACNTHLREALEIAELLIVLAERGEDDSEDDSCRLLYAIARDAGYKIRRQAENEREKHMAAGRWTTETPAETE